MFLFCYIFDKIYVSKGVIGIETINIKSIDITIKKGELISIIGPNGSGKSTIIKMLCGKFNNDSVYVDGKKYSLYSLKYKRNNIVCVFDDNIYNTKSPKYELKYYLNILKKDEEEIINIIQDFVKYFKLNKIFEKDFSIMNTEERIYVKILSLLIKPSVICIDDLLTYLDLDKKTKILNYIKENNITLISVTSNMEELKLYDKILVINKGKKEMFDKTEVVLKNEDLFIKLGLSLPFIYDINNILKSYDLISDNHIIEKELVDLLWK